MSTNGALFTVRRVLWFPGCTAERGVDRRIDGQSEWGRDSQPETSDEEPLGTPTQVPGPYGRADEPTGHYRDNENMKSEPRDAEALRIRKNRELTCSVRGTNPSTLERKRT